MCLYGEFFTNPKDGKEYSRVLTFNVVLKAGPAPRRYTPPDWSNHARWEELRDEEKACSTPPG